MPATSNAGTLLAWAISPKGPKFYKDVNAAELEVPNGTRCSYRSFERSGRTGYNENGTNAVSRHRLANHKT